MRMPEIRTLPVVDIEIPTEFARLYDLIYNLWWTWSSRAHLLFSSIDPVRWLRYRNPVELLINVEPRRWEALVLDEGFQSSYRSVVGEFDRYLAGVDTSWFRRTFPDYRGGPFAYFSTEYGWHESLGVYSGGLGILSGDHCKSASDLGLPFVGVGLLYRRGYFLQTVDADGDQQHFYPDYDLRRLPLLPVIGPGGKMIRHIQDTSGAKIDIEDDGTVLIAAVDQAAGDKALDMIKALTEDPEVGKVYKGTVRGIMPYGAFVQILPGRDGLLHVSEIDRKRVERVEDVLKLGDEIEVKIIGVDKDGKIKLSRKALL